MSGKKKYKIVSMDTVLLGEWQIKASQMAGQILLLMYNQHTHEFVIQYVDDIKKANIIVEYVIEKGTL
jgi:hypothetical protein